MSLSIWSSNNLRPINKQAAQEINKKRSREFAIKMDDLSEVRTTCDLIAAYSRNRTKKKYDYLLQTLKKSAGVRRIKLIMLISNHVMFNIRAKADSPQARFRRKWISLLAKGESIGKTAKKVLADQKGKHYQFAAKKIQGPPIIPPQEVIRLLNKKKTGKIGRVK